MPLRRCPAPGARPPRALPTPRSQSGQERPEDRVNFKLEIEGYSLTTVKLAPPILGCQGGVLNKKPAGTPCPVHLAESHRQRTGGVPAACPTRIGLLRARRRLSARGAGPTRLQRVFRLSCQDRSSETEVTPAQFGDSGSGRKIRGVK